MGLAFKISESFYPLLERRERYLVLYGGRGAGKSEFVARKLLLRTWVEERHRFMMVRKVRRTCRESVMRVMEELLKDNRVAYEYNRSELKLNVMTPRGWSEFLGMGLDDPEKIKSIKGVTGIWVEEATELSRDDFLKLDLCLREPVKSYHQVILTFNPMEDEAPWLKEMFFKGDRRDVYIHKSTIEDNPIKEVRDKYVGVLERLREQDLALWRIARLGEWATREGKIYNWEVRGLDEGRRADEVWYRCDFGYSVSPAAVVRVRRYGEELWVEEIVYQMGLTNEELARRMKEEGVRGEAVYCDAAEPKSIEELRRRGINARAAEKGGDSVRAGIDFLKSRKIYIAEGSINLVKESNGYLWRKDRGGNLMGEPVRYNDHLMDACRYAIYTHLRRPAIKVWRV